MAYYTSNRFNSMNLDANLIKKQINLGKDECTLYTEEEHDQTCLQRFFAQKGII